MQTSLCHDKPLSNVSSITPALSALELSLPCEASLVSAGFPSPAEQESGKRLDFNSHFIKNPNATFYVKVSGDSMIERRIDNGDILLVDRSVEPKNGSIIIARLHSDFCVRVLRQTETQCWLEPANKKYKSIEITSEMDFEVWGCVILNLVRLT